MPIYRGNVAGGGSSVAPSNTVEDETAFGVAKAPGAAAAYSRGDHTHGTPAAPSIPGPAATVEDETAFGVAKAAGVAATYSRGDHTHGTPAAPSIPTDSATVSDETTFGVAKAAGASADYSRGDHTHGTPAAPAVIISGNIFRGITPTSSVFTTAPTNLERTTDGDLAVVTGAGSKVMGGAGNFGIIEFDLGAVYTVMVGARVGLWTSAGSAFMFVESSNDANTWRSTGIEDSIVMSAAAAEQISDSLAHILTGRYIRLRFYVTAASTPQAKIYEVYGWPLVI